jgi:mannose-6-phosphate isomerase
MSSLYPIKFKPYYRKMIWGGTRMRSLLNKDFTMDNCGEIWEISAVQGNLSVVKNGFLAGNSIEEITEVYMSELLGEKVFEKYGIEFPLLIKFIDSNDDLSIQVHPNDELAMMRHQAYGKTEMWYVLEADPEATLITGFNRKLTQEEYKQNLENGTLLDILNHEEVRKGDVYFLPAGRVHALRKGIVLVEIQQTSDLTYRIYDWDRKDSHGKPRELHNEFALDAIDYNFYENYKTRYKRVSNEAVKLADSAYFVTSLLELDKTLDRDYSLLDSFVILINTQGKAIIEYGNQKIPLALGETVLIPADLERIRLVPDPSVTLLEVFVP